MMTSLNTTRNRRRCVERETPRRNPHRGLSHIVGTSCESSSSPDDSRRSVPPRGWRANAPGSGRWHLRREEKIWAGKKPYIEIDVDTHSADHRTTSSYESSRCLARTRSAQATRIRAQRANHMNRNTNHSLCSTNVALWVRSYTSASNSAIWSCMKRIKVPNHTSKWTFRKTYAVPQVYRLRWQRVITLKNCRSNLIRKYIGNYFAWNQLLSQFREQSVLNLLIFECHGEKCGQCSKSHISTPTKTASRTLLTHASKLDAYKAQKEVMAQSPLFVQILFST